MSASDFKKSEVAILLANHPQPPTPHPLRTLAPSEQLRINRELNFNHFVLQISMNQGKRERERVEDFHQSFLVL